MAARRRKKKQVRARGTTGVEREAIKARQTRKTKTQEVKIWESRLALARNVAKPYLDTYQRNLAFYVGKHFDAEDEADQLFLRNKVLVVNRMLPTLASQNAQIMWKLPWFRLVPRQPLGEFGEKNRTAAEMALNYILSSPINNLLLHARLFVLSSHLAYGVLKISFTPEEGVPEKREGVRTGKLTEEITSEGESVFEILEGRPRVNEAGNLVSRGRNRFELESTDPIKQFRIDWVDWRDLLHDPEGPNDLRDHRWLAQRTSWTLDEFMENEIFTNKEGIQDAARLLTSHGLMHQSRQRRLDRFVGPSGQDMSFQRDSGEPEDRDLMRIWGWQIWDFEERKVKYLVEGHDALVGNENIPDWIDHSPYVISKLHEVPGEFYPYTEAEAGRPLLRSYNMERSQRLNHTSRFNRKYEFVDGAVDDEEVEKIKNPEDGTLIRVSQLGTIKAIEDAPLDPAIYNDMELDVRDMSEIFGTTPEARGSAMGETATQAAILERRGSSREQDKRAVIGTALAQSADKMLDCIQKNLTASLAVRISGPQGQPFEASVSRIDIQGDFESRVEVIDMEPHDLNTERAQLLQLVQILGPVVMRVPLFVERIMRVFRFNDPELVTQVVAAYQEAREQELAAQQQQQQQQQQQGRRAGAAKPRVGPEGGKSTEGRQAGRSARLSAIPGAG